MESFCPLSRLWRAEKIFKNMRKGMEWMAKILAVDDEPAIRNLIRRALEKEGHCVTTLNCADEIIIENLNQYDLLLLDIMMP